MLIGSLVELHAWLHSYMCFSILEKRFLSYLDTSSIPPRHLAIYRALKLCSYRNLNRSLTARWIDWESSWTLDSWWIDWASFLVSLLCSSAPPRQLDQSTLFFLTPSSTNGSTPLDISICRELLRIYILAFCDPILISSISVDLFALVHLPNHSLSLQTSFPSDFQGFLFTWYVSFLSFKCISCFET